MNVCLFLLINIYRSSRTALLIIYLVSNYKQPYFKGEPPTEYASYPENEETVQIFPSTLRFCFLFVFQLKIYYS